jgi:hypothetical protein
VRPGKKPGIAPNLASEFDVSFPSVCGKKSAVNRTFCYAFRPERRVVILSHICWGGAVIFSGIFSRNEPEFFTEY